MWSSSTLFLALGWTPAHADPSMQLVQRSCRDQERVFFHGAPERDPMRMARCLEWEEPIVELEAAARTLQLERAALADSSSTHWGTRYGGGIGLGEMQQPYLSGDSEPGWASPRGHIDLRLYQAGLSLQLRPELGLDAGVDSSLPWIALREAWAGYRYELAGEGVLFGSLGRKDRWIGPGRRGSLVLSNQALAAPALSLGGAGAPLSWARLRGELGVGWLDGERSDVNHPGWLFMDLRWMPLPWVEFGASRVGIFGGEGRPMPRIGQLILPTDPHVYEDPDALLPDQDEIAALDARLTLPLDRWTGLQSLRYLEIWWQYGAEDIIAAESYGIPYPSLAGIANLYGAELAAGDVLLAAEGARIFDDYFRWYTGHRIYHQGFTRDGLNMAHWAGGDSLSTWLSLTWLQASRGVELWGEQITRIGVVENLDDRVLSLLTEEERLRLGLKGWMARSDGGWWRLGVSVEQIEGEDFVPGADGWTWRIGLEG
jgi:hypothetical protein